MASPSLALALLASVATLVACTERNTSSTAAPVRPLETFAALVLDPIAEPIDHGYRLAMRAGLADPALATLPEVDPCVVRIAGDQRALVPTLRAGAAGLDVPAGDGRALVGCSVAASAGRPALHAKALVAARTDTRREGEAVAAGTDAAACARLGLLAELTPLVDPGALGGGDDLPVRLAVDLGDARHIDIVVEHVTPDGTALRGATRTGDGGVAIVRLSGAGRYALTAHVVGHDLDGAPAPAVTSLAFAIGDARGGKR